MLPLVLLDVVVVVLVPSLRTAFLNSLRSGSGAGCSTVDCRVSKVEQRVGEQTRPRRVDSTHRGHRQLVRARHLSDWASSLAFVDESPAIPKDNRRSSAAAHSLRCGRLSLLIASTVRIVTRAPLRISSALRPFAQLQPLAWPGPPGTATSAMKHRHRLLHL